MAVRVGVAALVVYSDGELRMLIGKRKGSHGAGTWQLPGGHLEFGESFEECARREVLEETNLEVSDATFLTATNDIMHDENKHYVTIFMLCKVDASAAQNVRVMEPHKCECWHWIPLSDLKNEQSTYRPLFLPLKHLAELDHTVMLKYGL
ncbi:hypothetical protein BZG36_03249 [Bifiguratus adelaidae]|uniref:Nudix hydrolase domain-containing protein n=1 Tax=Bifiguratus adelaidae TaxID=1938954 RepID=A0A261Y011_9FUNG|nr:hypothetical protein BZG36_03249 [Bifiguratus adelaidae]